MFLTAFPYNLTLRLNGLIHLLESNQASCCITSVPLGGFLGRDEWQLYLTTNQDIWHNKRFVYSFFNISGSSGNKEAEMLEYLHHDDGS